MSSNSARNIVSAVLTVLGGFLLLWLAWVLLPIIWAHLEITVAVLAVVLGGIFYLIINTDRHNAAKDERSDPPVAPT